MIYEAFNLKTTITNKVRETKVRANSTYIRALYF